MILWCDIVIPVMYRLIPDDNSDHGHAGGAPSRELSGSKRNGGAPAQSVGSLPITGYASEG